MGSTHSQCIPLRDAYFGEGVGAIFLDRLQCNGSERELIGHMDCSLGGPVGIHMCDHSAVICTGA